MSQNFVVLKAHAERNLIGIKPQIKKKKKEKRKKKKESSHEGWSIDLTA